ncbi:MAG: hypothetical protein CMN72_07805 [Sphingomonas sp.]|nr:hypothetical protein [Sphingomonas sp.]
MSIRVMSQVWELDLPDSEKLVALALADWSNDDGVSWPSVAQIAHKCSKGTRTIQATLKRLEARGVLSRVDKPGRGSVWTLTPAKSAPLQNQHPRKIGTPATSAPTPAAAAPNTSDIPHSSQKTSSSSKARASKPDKLKPFRLPDDWQPLRFGDGTIARSVIDRRGIDWARAALESFRSWAANADDRNGAGRKLDWQAAWNKWVIEQDKRDGSRTRHDHEQQSSNPIVRARLARRAEADRERSAGF